MWDHVIYSGFCGPCYSVALRVSLCSEQEFQSNLKIFCVVFPEYSRKTDSILLALSEQVSN